MTNLSYFNQDNPPFLSTPSIIFTGIVCWCLWKEPVCWWWDEDADLQTDRVTVDARSDHHWQPQPRRQSGTWWRSPPPCARVLVASLPKWSAKRLSTHQLSHASAGVYDTFQHGAPDVAVQWVQIWRAWGPFRLLSEPIRIQSVLHDTRTLRKAGCLGWNSIILWFSDIFQPNLVIKCIVWQSRKISCKNLHTRLKYQQKSQGGGATFLCSPGTYITGLKFVSNCVHF